MGFDFCGVVLSQSVAQLYSEVSSSQSEIYPIQWSLPGPVVGRACKCRLYMHIIASRLN